MQTAIKSVVFATLLGLLGSVVLAPSKRIAAQEIVTSSPTNASEDVEVLARGPIHEAFAEQYNPNPAPGLIVPKRAPEPIEEIPPENAPEGEDVQWIPGYWAWDDERKDFNWISGVWRIIPPGKRWVPGYWAQAQGGHQWISGFWTRQAAEELDYLPTPPESLETGPNSEPPSEDHFWLPGCWVFDAGRYRWRPGYWGPTHEDWVWIPSRYVWTPTGCLYVDGYWDYRIPRRGLLFAPIHFHHQVYRNPGYYYSPHVVIDTTPLLIHLFVRPSYHHYYFGDYYGDPYLGFGIYPWYSYHRRHHHYYDPLWTYYNWHFRRHGHDIGHRIGNWHHYLREHRDLRPPRTILAQRDFVNRHRDNRNLNQFVLSRPLRDVVSKADSPRRFRQLNNDQRRELGRTAGRFRGIERQRLNIERGAVANRTGENAVGRTRPRLNLPQLSDRRTVRAGRDGAGARADASRIRRGARPADPRPTPSGSRAGSPSTPRVGEFRPSRTRRSGAGSGAARSRYTRRDAAPRQESRPPTTRRDRPKTRAARPGVPRSRPSTQNAPRSRSIERSAPRSRSSARSAPGPRPSARSDPRSGPSTRSSPRSRPSARSAPRPRPSTRSAPRSRSSAGSAPRSRGSARSAPRSRGPSRGAARSGGSSRGGSRSGKGRKK